MASVADLLSVSHGRIHDPTTPNRQGNDMGTQYRSAIFYHDEEQKKAAEEKTAELQKTRIKGKIATTIEPFEHWWTAEGESPCAKLLCITGMCPFMTGRSWQEESTFVHSTGMCCSLLTILCVMCRVPPAVPGEKPWRLLQPQGEVVKDLNVGYVNFIE